MLNTIIFKEIDIFNYISQQRTFYAKHTNLSSNRALEPNRIHPLVGVQRDDYTAYSHNNETRLDKPQTPDIVTSYVKDTSYQDSRGWYTSTMDHLLFYL